MNKIVSKAQDTAGRLKDKAIRTYLRFTQARQRTAAVLSAAMPMLGIYPILGQKYGQADLCASALLVTTIASFFTLSSLLWVLKNFPAFS